jgi:hypothetical protein
MTQHDKKLRWKDILNAISKDSAIFLVRFLRTVGLSLQFSIKGVWPLGIQCPIPLFILDSTHMCIGMTELTWPQTCTYKYMCECTNIRLHVYIHMHACMWLYMFMHMYVYSNAYNILARPSGSAWQSSSSWLHPRNEHNGAFFVKQIANEITRSLPWEQGSRRSLCCGAWQHFIFPSLFPLQGDRFEQFDFKSETLIIEIEVCLSPWQIGIFYFNP